MLSLSGRVFQIDENDLASWHSCKDNNNPMKTTHLSYSSRLIYFSDGIIVFGPSEEEIIDKLQVKHVLFGNLSNEEILENYG